ncbi:MAG TPA: AI-2E family transporter [Caulobacteraceae bacterium]|nr:AI-2E family transporter [Caulobacteraceae bacterium]
MTAQRPLIPALPQAAPSSTARNALILIAVVASGFALFALQAILTPLALALFLMVLIDGFSRVLRQRLPSLSEGLAFVLAILLTVVGFVGAAALVAEDAGQFLGQLVTNLPRLNRVIAEVGPHVGLHAAPTVDELMRQLDPVRYVGAVAQALQGFASESVLVMIYLGFLFASRPGLRHKTERLFPVPEERENARQVFMHIRNGIERYLWVQTVSGLIIAAGSGVVIALVGMDDALFWAFLVLVASYVPIIGGLAAMLLPCLFALVSFDAHWHALALFAGLSVINFGVGNILLPRMQGRSLNLDAVVILLALSFWGLVWGITGMFLSTPLTVTLMVVAEQFPGAKWLAILLSGDGDPETPLQTAGPDPSASLPASGRPARRGRGAAADEPSAVTKR